MKRSIPKGKIRNNYCLRASIITKVTMFYRKSRTQKILINAVWTKNTRQKISQISQKSTCAGVVLKYNCRPRDCNFTNKRLQRMRFLLHFAKFILKNYFVRLLLEAATTGVLWKSVLKNFVKFTEKHPHWSLFFNKVAFLRPTPLLKKRPWHRRFLVNFANFLKNAFLSEHLRASSFLASEK